MPRGPVGFAVRDATGQGGTFAIDERGSHALVFGSTSALRVTAQGVLPAHVVVLPVGDQLVAASASAAQPALLNGAPLPTSWTMLAVPSRIRVGAAAIDFFFVRASGAGAMVVDQDVETTVADPGTTRSDTMRVGRVPIDRPWAPVTSLKAWWRSASTSTRVLLGVVAILVAFLVAR